MTLRTDIPFVELLATGFQEFDHGGIIEQSIPTYYRMREGDGFHWSCGSNLQGIAEVIGCTEPRGGYVACTIRKVN
ncbi:MAG: hypothetical protein Q7R93_02600 [bacterium]|nr:hypothetical protein [bacterium]